MAVVRYEIELGVEVADTHTALRALRRHSFTTAGVAAPGTHVLDLSTTRQPVLAACDVAAVSHVAMDPAGGADLFAVLPECFDVISEQRARNHTVLICCESGRNQSVVVAVSFLMLCCGTSLSGAIELVKQRYRASCLSDNTSGAEQQQQQLQLQRPRPKTSGCLPSLRASNFRQQGEQKYFDAAHRATLEQQPEDCFPAPEPCYLQKLIEVEEAFLKTRSFAGIADAVVAFYGPAAKITHVLTWRQHLLKGNQCSQPFLGFHNPKSARLPHACSRSVELPPVTGRSGSPRRQAPSPPNM
eukprot:TRINITY_DN1301_c0_g1_i1.p1 TRINITY_DN1301_c0_g1~~TRINITY_DN1301_c0_g1_i1.p1  ORF type:complete len:312 (+),score=73.00 TRINITY_DN1301_c0_g1_i1:37-936(+)